MECPNCHEEMRGAKTCDRYHMYCQECDGTWVGGKEIRALIELNSKSNLSIEDIDKYNRTNSKISVSRKCPECKDIPLYEISTQRVEIDYCLSCKGIFFDRGELSNFAPDTINWEVTKDLKDYAKAEGLVWSLYFLLTSWL